MKLSLVVMNAGKTEGQRIPITVPQFIIGRDPECNLRPASAIISKRHCALLMKDGAVSLRDFESTNGTFVNDEIIKGEVALNNDDVVKIGPLTFRVLIEVKPPGSKPTPIPPKAHSSDDDSAAEILLSLQEEGASPDASTQAGEAVPAGSTVMDFMTPPPDPAAAKAQAEAEAKLKKEAEAKKKAEADPAYKAAKAILDKYTRRSRSST